jgi:hypothetical protein
MDKMLDDVVTSASATYKFVELCSCHTKNWWKYASLVAAAVHSFCFPISSFLPHRVHLPQPNRRATAVRLFPRMPSPSDLHVAVEWIPVPP